MSLVVFGLLTWIVSTEVASAAIDGGTKLFETVSGDRMFLTAASAITMPTPESRSFPAASMSSADARIAVVICALVADAFADLMSAAIEAAVDAAADVPQNVVYPTVACGDRGAVRVVEDLARAVGAVIVDVNARATGKRAADKR